MKAHSKTDFNLERELIDQILKARLNRTHLLVGVSGGADSMALAIGLARVRNRLKELTVTWAHVHHGSTRDLVQLEFRDQAQTLVRETAVREGVPCVGARIEDGILRSTSEDQFRRARYDRLQTLARAVGAKKLVLGHTQSDVFETRLLRLMRGVGPKGLTAMERVQGFRFRPLLQVTREEVEVYLNAHQLPWLNDPSNLNLDFARNELRHLILQPMPKRRPEWVRGLRRSLSRIAADLQHYDQLMAASTADILRKSRGTTGLDRSSFGALDPQTQRGVLVQYIRLISASVDDAEWTRDQVEEVRKRINSKQKRFEFSVGGQAWYVDSETISIAERAAQK